MLDHEPDADQTTPATTPPPRTRRRAASRPAGPPSAAATPPPPSAAEAAAPEPPSPSGPTAPDPAAEPAVPVGGLEPAATTSPDPVSDRAGAPGSEVAEPGLTGAAESAPEVPAKKAAAKRAPRRTAKKAAAPDPDGVAAPDAEAPAAPARAPRKRAARKTAAVAAAETSADDLLATDVSMPVAAPAAPAAETTASEPPAPEAAGAPDVSALGDLPVEPVVVTEQAVPEAPAEPAPTPAETEAEPEPAEPEAPQTGTPTEAGPDVVVAPVDQPAPSDTAAEGAEPDDADDSAGDDETDDADDSAGDDGGRRRRRRRGGRRRRRTGGDGSTGDEDDSEGDEPAAAGSATPGEPGADAETDEPGDASADGDEGDGQRRRRRRRRRRGEEAGSAPDDPTEVVVRVREPRRAAKENNEITGISGSTRMEAKRQRRREGREAGRRRAPILSEAEFLARRESVARTMVVRQRDDPSTGSGSLTQIAVLEDDVLVEHYVDRESATSLIGNVYLGRVQNVLPSMEAAFIDIGRGRNAVLYAGEVDWDSFGASGQNRKVEKVLKSGQTVLVQVSKDPVGAKGARLTNHVSIPGRYIVYAPSGHLSGISRKLPDNERRRLKDILHDLVGEASVIVRTAAEGASEDELVRDVNRLKAQWADIEKKVASGQAPQLLYGEPDLTVRIVRDLFTEDFADLVIDGNGGSNDAYDAVEGYVRHVAPHLADRLKRYEAPEGTEQDVFARYRIDEQIAKALERKVFLPSGGSLVIDRTEAMTVIDVNTGKFTGSGGNLEATVTSNNLEAAEEIVRQLRLRDIGGIIVIDFIDMVLPNNRELLLRRLVECLGRDRTRHQVAEVTSLGLVQMTRKKIGTGLLEAFTSECPHCHGRGVELHDMPVESQRQADGGARDARPGGHRRGGDHGGNGNHGGNGSHGNGQQGGGNGRRGGSEPSGRSEGGRSEGGRHDAGGDETPTPDTTSADDGEGRSGRSRRGGRGRRGGSSAPETPAESGTPVALAEGVASSSELPEVPPPDAAPAEATPAQVAPVDVVPDALAPSEVPEAPVPDASPDEESGSVPDPQDDGATVSPFEPASAPVEDVPRD